MKLQNVVKILKVLKLLSQMPMAGKGATRPTIIHYSGVPASSTQRYLKRLQELKLVDVHFEENRNNQQVSYWHITLKGEGYILDDERMFG